LKYDGSLAKYGFKNEKINNCSREHATARIPYNYALEQ
jgi:hypothetical protein